MDSRCGGVFKLSAVELDNGDLGIDTEDRAVSRNVAVQESGPGEKYALASTVCGEGKDAGIHNGRGRRAVCWVEVWEDGETVCLVHGGYLQQYTLHVSVVDALCCR